MRVVVNEDMKVFHGHVPAELKKGQEVTGSLAELLLTSAPRKVTRADAEPAPADELDIDGKIEDVLEWVGDDQERALAAHIAESEKDKPRSTLLSRLDEILA